MNNESVFTPAYKRHELETFLASFKDHQIKEVFRSIIEDSLRAILEIVEPSESTILLFGSVARGEYGAMINDGRIRIYSDIDIAVVVKQQKDKAEKLGEVAQRLLHKYKDLFHLRALDIHFFQLDLLVDSRKLFSGDYGILYYELFNESVILHGNDVFRKHMPADEAWNLQRSGQFVLRHFAQSLIFLLPQKSWFVDRDLLYYNAYTLTKVLLATCKAFLVLNKQVSLSGNSLERQYSRWVAENRRKSFFSLLGDYVDPLIRFKEALNLQRLQEDLGCHSEMEALRKIWKLGIKNIFIYYIILFNKSVTPVNILFIPGVFLRAFIKRFQHIGKRLKKRSAGRRSYSLTHILILFLNQLFSLVTEVYVSTVNKR